MKKSLINIAISMAISSALFSASVLSTQVYANELSSAGNNNSNDIITETYMLPGMGAGAAAGAVVAGPVGLIIGGLIGAFVGENQQVTNNNETTATDVARADATWADKPLAQEPDNTTENTIDQQADTTFSEYSANEIQVAQLGGLTPVIEKQSSPVQDELVNILTTDLSLDVYFRSGSTDIESFYPARLAAIAELMKTMDKLELHLDGYSDRRGSKTRNIALANERIEKVREQLINAGVNENRIISKAFGEMKMVSSAGDLEGYTFDRKVVIRFERSNADSISSMTSALSASKTVIETEDATVSGKDAMQNNEDTAPVVADVSTRF